MPVFVVLVFLGAGLLWLLAAFAFVPLGRLVCRLWKDAKNAMEAGDPIGTDIESKEGE